MIELYLKLIDELKREKACYLRLTSLTLEQKECLILGDVNKVAENLRKQEKEVFALSPLLGERNDLISILAKSLQLAESSLAVVLKKAPMEIVEDLKKATIELVQTARELETINQGNEKLAHNALSLADVTLQALASKGRPKSAGPMAKNAQVESSFVNRVV